MRHAAGREAPEACKGEGMGGDQLKEIGCFGDRDFGNADVKPSPHELIKDFLVIDHSDEQVRVSASLEKTQGRK